MLLHNETAIVTEQDLEQELERIRLAARSASDGAFGPTSMMWHVNREAVLFLCAGRALLLQLAHPWVAAAVTEHSRVLTQPLLRFQRTFEIVFALVFGTLDQALAAARRLHRRHSTIVGSFPAATGPFPAGSTYRANNASALRWVHATLIDSARVAYDLVLPPLPSDRLEQFYAESRLFGAFFGIPPADLPADWVKFTTYNEAMWDSDVLTVSPAARALAAKILAGTGTWLPVPEAYRALTTGLLPGRVRDGFGLPLGMAERRACDRALRWARRIYPALPHRLRYVAPYQEAMARVAGRAHSDLATQILNRLWIGKPSLTSVGDRRDPRDAIS